MTNNTVIQRLSEHIKNKNKRLDRLNFNDLLILKRKEYEKEINGDIVKLNISFIWIFL